MNIKSYNLHKTALISVCFVDSAYYDPTERSTFYDSVYTGSLEDCPSDLLDLDVIQVFEAFMFSAITFVVVKPSSDCIDHYAIYAKKNYSAGYYFCEGYKTLPTMKKYFQKMKDKFSTAKHDHCILVAMSYDKKPIKCYDFF